MQIAQQIVQDPPAALEIIAGKIPAHHRELIAKDLAHNLVIAASQAGAPGPYMYHQMIELSRAVLEPVHMESWAMEIKAGIGIEQDDFESFALILYSVVGTAVLEHIEK